MTNFSIYIPGLEQAITSAADNLISNVGLESAIYLLDCLATKGAVPWANVAKYIQDKSSQGTSPSPSALEEVVSNISSTLGKIIEIDKKNIPTNILQCLKYEVWARLSHKVPSPFMNYGFHSAEPIELGGHDPNFTPAVQLYHYVASHLPANPGRLLEVGSGNGGGADYVFRTFKPITYTGIDLCFANVRFSREHYQRNGLSFVHGDAQSLPFEDLNIFDAIINIESLHCYPEPEKFLREAERVLAQGGIFLLADLFKEGKLDSFRSLVDKTSLSIRDSENITDGVYSAYDESVKLKRELAKHLDAELRLIYLSMVQSRGFNRKETNWNEKGMSYHRITIVK